MGALLPWADTGWAVRVRDLALVALCAALGVDGAGNAATTPGPRWVLIACLCLGCAVLPWRRVQPVGSLAVAAVPLAAYFLVFGAPENGGMLLLLTTLLYAVGRWAADRRRAAVALALMVPVLVAHEWRDPTNTSWHAVLLALPYDGLALCAWLLGAFVRARGEQRSAAAERIAAEERTRIARELHDIVAHGLAVMVLQAEGAAEIVGRDPERARRAMERVADNGRASLVELRRALGALRDPVGTSTAPQPGLARLQDLLGTVRDTGLSVELVTSGAPQHLPAGVELTVYRIIQEALTNTLRHARAGRVIVRLHHYPDRIDLEVSDDGFQPNGHVPTGEGRGLLGMRERVGLLGGSIETGYLPAGGFRVAAVLPVGGRP